MIRTRTGCRTELRKRNWQARYSGRRTYLLTRHNNVSGILIVIECSYYRLIRGIWQDLGGLCTLLSAMAASRRDCSHLHRPIRAGSGIHQAGLLFRHRKPSRHLCQYPHGRQTPCSGGNLQTFTASECKLPAVGTSTCERGLYPEPALFAPQTGTDIAIFMTFFTLFAINHGIIRACPTGV